VRKRRIIIAATAATLAAGTSLVLATGSAEAEQPINLDDARAALQGNVDADVIDAMKRDLGLTTNGVYDRLAVDDVTSDIAELAATRYGDDYAGTWTNDAGTGTVVAVTDPALVDDIEAMGAKADVVDHSLDQLTADKQKLDNVTTVPDGVYSWAVDITTNTLRLNANDADTAQAFLDKAGVDADINTNAQQPETFADIIGGDAYYINGSGRCSVGFPVTHAGGSGFVSAGHCGSAGDSVAGVDQSDLGQFEASTFPGSDYSWVSANANWTSAPVVNGYGQANVDVTDGNEAATGAAVCRSGSTTGMHCGTIGAKDQTVSYPQGIVNGMTETDVCAEPGDSGGSWVSGGSAQGVTSGGSGNCSSGGTTYFFPLTPILQAYPELTLSTV
jgi:streptogrisin C